jgi:UDP-glucuronate 4-epimerase
MANPILVTGAAGFIGFHLTQRLLADGHSVVGLDNINSYYSPKLKQARLSILARHEKFQFVELDLARAVSVADLFAQHQFAYVLHLVV